MEPNRIREMMSTGSPGLTDHAIRMALTNLSLTKPTKRRTSPYALPVLTHGLDNAEAIITRSIRLAQEQGL